MKILTPTYLPFFKRVASSSGMKFDRRSATRLFWKNNNNIYIFFFLKFDINDTMMLKTVNKTQNRTGDVNFNHDYYKFKSL